MSDDNPKGVEYDIDWDGDYAVAVLAETARKSHVEIDGYNISIESANNRISRMEADRDNLIHLRQESIDGLAELRAAIDKLGATD